MNSNSLRLKVGKYELGKTLGEGTFAKVKIAKNLETGASVAIKILDKDKILKHRMVQQVTLACVFTSKCLLEHEYMSPFKHFNHKSWRCNLPRLVSFVCGA